MDRGIFLFLIIVFSEVLCIMRNVLTSIDIMSRFNTLLKGLSETAPQIKGSLKNWAEELKILQANPAGNERRIQELSDNIRSTVEANAVRDGKLNKYPEQQILSNQPEITKSSHGNILIAGEGKPAANLIQESKGIQVNPKVSKQDEIMKKVAGIGVAPAAGAGMQNPVDMLKEGYDKFETARGKVSDALADQVTGYLPQVSKEKSIDQARAVMDTATDPLSYVGGVGAIDAGLGAASALPTIDEETKARFKGLFGN